MFDRVEPLHLSIYLLIVCARVCMSVPPQETWGMNAGRQSWWPYPPQGAILLVFHCCLYACPQTFSEFLCFGICFPDKHIPQMSSESHTRADRYAESSGVLSLPGGDPSASLKDLPSNFLPSVLGTECRN